MIQRYRNGLFRALLLALGVLVVGRLMMPAAHASDVRFAIEFSHIGGDLTPGQREAMLRSAKIEAQYSPSAEIPGVTAHWKRCGFFELPCLKPKFHYFRPAPGAVEHSGSTLTFSVPPRHGGMLHRLSTITIEMSGPRTFRDRPGQQVTLRIPVNCEFCRQGEGSFIVRDRYELLQLGGLFRAKGVKVDSGDGCDPSNCVFPEMGRFDGYARLLQHNVSWWAASRQETELREPYPAELAGLEIVQARLVTTRFDGHLLERIELQTRKGNSCSEQREVFLVDGKVTSYQRERQEQNCSTDSASARIVSASWSEDGRPLSFDDFITDPYVRKIAQWTAWHGARTGATPQAQMLSELQKDGMRLRRYFSAGR